ncbi:MAG: T9SS type A sorting domain-containing protein [Bacteroidetes bacterium]|nr:T9SS type A sorting domain-containing protein [Bacteroidota bacterium]
MKKLILILITALFMSSAAFTQIVLSAEFGPTAFSPSITFNGAPGDYEIVAHIGVTNSGTESINVKVAREQLFLVDGSRSQFCWGVCYSFDTDTSGMSIPLAPGESTNEFSGHYQPQTTEGVSIVKYTFYDENDPSGNFASVIVHYNSLFSISSLAGDSISKHIRLLNGFVDDPIHGVINIHNHASVPLNFIALKGMQMVLPNTENWFWFDGVQYPASVDTSGLVSIGAGTTDESFEAFYDAAGVEGVSTVYYVFMDPTNPTSYAVFQFSYNAESTGISDNILENTTFSAAYPNPAESFVSFDYDIPNEVNRAEILITNLLGAVVFEGTLSGLNGTERIDVSNFTEGIYFATLKLDNYIASTQKVLIR